MRALLQFSTLPRKQNPVGKGTSEPKEKCTHKIHHELIKPLDEIAYFESDNANEKNKTIAVTFTIEINLLAKTEPINIWTQRVYKPVNNSKQAIDLL